MEDYGFQVARADLLEKAGRLFDAAELHLSEGHLVKAIQLFVKDGENAASRQRAEQCLLDALWQHLSFGVTVKKGTDLSQTPLGELLSWAKKMEKVLSPKALDEVSLVKSLNTRCKTNTTQGHSVQIRLRGALASHHSS